MGSPPNIVVVLLDTARADAFSPYADTADTPTVAQVASRGTAYPNAFAPCCWTVPSHASMFLGAPPRSVGLSRLPNGEARQVAPVIESQRDRWLPEVLRRSGYATAGISANLWIAARTGFSTGFDSFEEISGHRVARMSQNDLRSRLLWYAHAVKARADDGAIAIERKLEEWLGRVPRSPFFWFVNLLECHSPYLPPRPYNDLSAIQRIAAAEDARRYQTLEAVMRAAATGKGAPKRAARRMRHLYDRSIKLMDDWLARFLQSLDTARLLDDTVVIVTSDHGENFGEGGLLGHSGSLDDRLLRIPLVMAGPGVEGAGGAAISLSELPMLIADIAGVSDHPWEPVPHPGVAVAQFDGPLRPGHPNMHVLDEWNATPEGRIRLTHRISAATDGSLKLVRTQAGDRLYDVTRDPLELFATDESRHPLDRVGALRGALDRAGEQAWDPDPDEPVATESEEELRSIEERMKLLGYL